MIELFNAKTTLLVYELFQALDWTETGSLDDITFQSILEHATDLKPHQIYKIFDLFDLDSSGSVEFDEFYLMMCILTAVKDGAAKRFLFQHWKTCFEVLDADGSGAVSMNEFQTLGLLLNFSNHSIAKIYQEFNIVGKQELDQKDFQLFVMAAVELEATLNQQLYLEKNTARTGWIGMAQDVLDSVLNFFKQ